MNRWKASGIHFLISLAVFVCLLAVILLVWYPGLLFELNGGWEGLRIVIGVDLVLGPMLTLIVYKVGKPSLKFDLTSIALFQSICLLAGVWVVYQERPVVLAFEYDSIFSLSAREYKGYGNELAALEKFSGSYPKKVFIELPGDDIQALSHSVELQLNNEPLYGDAQNYQELPESNLDLVRDASSLRAAAAAQLEQEFPEDCLLAQFVSSSQQGFVCLDPATRSITAFY
jgi:hypothetical protein